MAKAVDQLGHLQKFPCALRHRSDRSCAAHWLRYCKERLMNTNEIQVAGGIIKHDGIRLENLPPLVGHLAWMHGLAPSGYDGGLLVVRLFGACSPLIARVFRGFGSCRFSEATQSPPSYMALPKLSQSPEARSAWKSVVLYDDIAGIGIGSDNFTAVVARHWEWCKPSALQDQHARGCCAPIIDPSCARGPVPRISTGAITAQAV